MLATLAGLAFVAVELHTGNRERRVSQTLGFVERFNDQTIIEARRNIQAAWLPYARFFASEVGGEGLSRAQLDELAVQIIRADQENNGGALLLDIMTVTSFFDELALCAQRGCDKPMVCDYFDQYAADFLTRVAPIFVDVEQSFDLRGMASGLVKFDREAADAICPSDDSGPRGA